MARGNNIKMNYKGIQKMLQSDSLERYLQGKMEDVADEARSIAPYESGDYHDSIEPFTEKHPTRVVGHVIANAPHSLVLEARLGILGRALDAAKD